MKPIIGVFIIVLISIGIADLLQGVLLTFLYTPKVYTASNLQMAIFLRYIIFAITITLAIWSVHKFTNVFKSPSKKS